MLLDIYRSEGFLVKSLRIWVIFLICISLSLSRSACADGVSQRSEKPFVKLPEKELAKNEVIEKAGLAVGVPASSPEDLSLMLRPLTVKEKQARITFLLKNKTLTVKNGEKASTLCNAIFDNSTSQDYKILKPEVQEIFVQKNSPFRTKDICPRLELDRVYVPAASKAERVASSAYYAVDVTRNFEGYNLSSYSDGIWLYTGEETLVDKESAKEVDGMIGHENETLVRLVDKKQCLIKTPIEESLRMLRRYNLYIDRPSWKVFYEDTPSFSAVLDIGGHPYFLVFSSFFVSWNQFLSSSDVAGVVILERIDLASGKFEKVCNFNVK